MKDGQDIYNANGIYLYFSSLQLSDAGVYICRVTTNDGTVYSREIIVNNTTGLKDIEFNLLSFELYPNPVQGITTLKFILSENSKVSLEIINMSGALVLVQDLGEQTVGPQQIELNCSGLTPGTYFCRLWVGKAMAARRFIVK
jgi:hypothetical protein